MTQQSDTVFAGTVPELYERHLVPLIFAPYAWDLARRARAHADARSLGQPIERVLEIACGTGVVTRALATTFLPSVEIVATDLNPAMLTRAASVAIARPVVWQEADALHLPFGDASFDVVVCQFGAMFFPDKGAAFAEARRVLRPGGVLLLSVWDRIEDNELAHVVTEELAALFPHDPPRFLARTPHGYHDVATLRADLVRGGFATPLIETVAERSRAASPEIPAIAYCQGTPLTDEITQRDRAPSALERATNASTRAIERRFGTGAIDSKIQAHVVTALR